MTVGAGYGYGVLPGYSSSFRGSFINDLIIQKLNQDLYQNFYQYLKWNPNQNLKPSSIGLYRPKLDIIFKLNHLRLGIDFG